MGIHGKYPLVNVYSSLLKIAIDIVDFSMKNGGPFHSFLYVYQRVPTKLGDFVWANVGKYSMEHMGYIK